MRILAIETSCDETSVAILTTDVETLQGSHRGDNISERLTLVTASQIDVHRVTGGIVPEVAAREHVQVMVPLIEEAMKQAGVTPDQVDRIAVTSGPGLMTSLMVGVETARTLGYGWNKPVFPINHIEGHIAANFLEHDDIVFPAVALVVSGGHTELLLVTRADAGGNVKSSAGELHYELIGATRDDAAGECFDKCARILDLPYPGGPEISRLALEGDASVYEFPRPMMTSGDFAFSFSGLKTAVLYYRRDNPKVRIEDICAAVEQAIVDVLVSKTQRAVEEYGAQSLLVGGGVAANQKLRAGLTTMMTKYVGDVTEEQVPCYIPSPEYCTDNAAMIAAACQFHSEPAGTFDFTADPNWELTPR